MAHSKDAEGICPKCQGKVICRYGLAANGQQRFLCVLCGHQFTKEHKKIISRRKPSCPVCGKPMYLYKRTSAIWRFRCSCYLTHKGEYAMTTKRKIKVLFVCIHNSARSQMAEAFLNQLGGEKFVAQSAGMEPGEINPLAVEVMKEVGIDISRNKTNSVFNLFKNCALFNYVITVCDEVNAERCPIFPGITKRLHWSFADPATLTGSHAEKLIATRGIRDEIRDAVISFIDEPSKAIRTDQIIHLKAGKFESLTFRR